MLVRVSGRQLTADGRACLDEIVITPSRTGMVDGILVDTRAITVAPRSDGSFRVELICSEVAGYYTFQMGGGTMRVWIPAGETYVLGS